MSAGKDVSDRWYDEVKQYNFNRPGFSSGTGERDEKGCSSVRAQSCTVVEISLDEQNIQEKQSSHNESFQ